MKRKLLIVYVFAIFVLLCTNVYAALTMNVSLVPVSEKVKQGSDLIVAVKLNNISEPISSIEGYINVDENVLEPISADMIKGDRIEIKSDGKTLSELDYIFNPTNANADYDVIFNTNKENIDNNDCFFIMDLRKDIQGNCDIMILNFKVKEDATVSQATQAVKFKISSAVAASNPKDKAENISANLNFEVLDKNANVDDPKPSEPDTPKAPTGTVSYSTTTETTDEVIATLKVDDGVKVTNNNGQKTRVFKENGTFVFEFEDGNGNKGTAEAKVTWIKAKTPDNDDKPEKKELKGTITYSTTKETSDKVIATLTVDSGVTITNNGGKDTHTFTQNGEFTFTFKDNDGNEGKATAKVTWIKKKTDNSNTNNNNTNTNKNTNNNKNVNANKNVNDTTVSGSKIPKAGAKMLILPVIVCAILGYVSYIKYLKYKEF